MSGVSKPAAAAPGDDLDAIMNEIEALQKEMASAELSKPKAAAPALKVVEPVAEPVVETPVEPVAEEPLAEAEVSEPEVSEDDALKEFHAAAGAGAGEGSLEETLGDLKDESEGGGSSLLDSVVAEETPVEASEEAPEEAAEETSEEFAAEAAVESEADECVEEVVAEEDPAQEYTVEEDSQEEVSAMPKPERKEEGTLTMTLTGNMTLKLKYEYEGQEVTVGFSDQFLMVQLADGTEFKVPVGRAPRNLRRVA